MDDLNNKEVFTVSDAARYLSVSRATLYNWMKAGIIKGVRISPRKVLIYKKDIIRIFEESEGYERPKKK